MKKLFIIFAMIGTLGLGGCTNKQEITINKDTANSKEQIKERLTGNSIGIYDVNNLEKGKYKVSITSDVYNDGKLKESSNILTSEMEIKNNKDNLNIGINKTDKDILTFDISQNNKDEFMASTSQGLNLSKFNGGNIGVTWNMLENASEGAHKIELGKNLAIASFSTGKDRVTHGIALGNDFVKPSEASGDISNNMVDVIIYLKISKI